MGTVTVINLTPYDKQNVPEVNKELEKFITTYNDIVENYYMDVDKEDLLNNAVKGMLESLEDDYSYLTLFTDTEMKEVINELYIDDTVVSERVL